MDAEVREAESPEAMGLRLEGTVCLRPLDAVLLVALVVSGAAWGWVSVAGVEPGLLAVLNSRAGRVTSALIGAASVLALLRMLTVRRWPVSDNDRTLV
jgi:hypothetical protein